MTRYVKNHKNAQPPPELEPNIRQETTAKRDF